MPAAWLSETETWQGPWKPGRVWIVGVPSGSALLLEAGGIREAAQRLLGKINTPNWVFVKEPQ